MVIEQVHLKILCTMLKELYLCITAKSLIDKCCILFGKKNCDFFSKQQTTIYAPSRKKPNEHTKILIHG